MASNFVSDFFPGHSPPPPVRSLRFHLRNVYIVPSAAGMGLLGVVLISLVAAINFQNSLIYMVSFWLGSLLVINILYTFRNLSGVELELMGAEPCFAGQNCLVSLRISGSAPKESIYVGWRGVDLALVDLQESLSMDTRVSYPAPERGQLKPPRLDIFTRYPTGLTVAWAYARLDINAVVYPAPVDAPDTSRANQASEDAHKGPTFDGGVSDFAGLRRYQPGDSPRRIHWAKFARTGRLHSKLFVDYRHPEVWLNWEDTPGSNNEIRLSHLCAKVLELHARQQTFGLRLPGKTISPDTGDTHQVACLTALALWEMG
jgi:uncharacterized protein (DUF58 family)